MSVRAGAVAANLARLQSQIAGAEARFGRPPGGVSLLAVSKTHAVAAIAAAVDAGQFRFAENYLQELKQKAAALAQGPHRGRLEWHFIGSIQSKKVRDLARLCDWVHSVDRLKVAQGLSASRDDDTPLNVCIQVNLDRESSKSGVAPDELSGLVDEVARLPRIVLRGLMAIPKPQPDFERQRESFARLRHLFDLVAPPSPAFDTLSAGMSGDFEAAIAEGATMVRIGTALFGPRR